MGAQIVDKIAACARGIGIFFLSANTMSELLFLLQV